MGAIGICPHKNDRDVVPMGLPLGTTSWELTKRFYYFKPQSPVGTA